MTKEVKGHGFLRKTKVGVVSGIALGVTALSVGTSVSADEVTPTDNAAPTTTSTTDVSSSLPVEVSETPFVASEKVEDLATEEVRSYKEEQTTTTPIKLGDEVEGLGTVTNPNPAPQEPAKTEVGTTENKVSPVGATDITDPNPTVEVGKSEIKGTYTVDLKEETKTSTETTTKSEWKPMDLVAILDFSGSTSADTSIGGSKEKEGYRKFMFESLKNLIEKDLTDDSNVQIAFYGANTAESYAANEKRTDNQQLLSASTNLVSKKSAITILDSLIKQNATKLSDVLHIATEYLYDTSKGITPFEAIYQEQKKKDLVSVIQYTDEWNLDEEIDSSFASWAKSNAKTFMSVLHKDTGNYSLTYTVGAPTFNGTYAKSKTAMEAAGHPNIYIWNQYGKDSKPADSVKSDIIKTFENTAVEKSETTTTTTVIKPSMNFVVGVKDGAKIKSGVLTKPDGSKQTLEVKLNGDLLDFDGKDLPGGKYQLDWVAEGPGSVITAMFVNGKEAIKDTKEAAGQFSVFLKIVDESGKELKRHRVAAGSVGDSYIIKEPTVASGATISKVSGDLSGKIEAKDKEVVYKVTPKVGMVTVRFVDDQGKSLADTVTLSTSSDWSLAQDIVNRKEITKDGVVYELVKQPNVTSGKASRDSVEITYVYAPRKVVRTVSLRVVDSTGKELLASTPVFKGYAGSSFEVKAPTVKGYELSLKDGKASDTLSDKDVMVTYLAQELASPVEAHYYIQGKDGELIEVALKDLVSDAKFVGTDFKFGKEVPKEIEVNGFRYILTATPETLEGKTLSRTQELQFVYKREEAAKVIAKFVDENGNEVSKEIIVSEGGFTGDVWSYKDAPQEIEVDGKKYLLTLSPDVLEGKLSHEDIVLTFTYKEEVKPVEPEFVPRRTETPSKPVSVPTPEVKTLPNTGTEASALTAIGALTGMLGLVGLRKRKED